MWECTVPRWLAFCGFSHPGLEEASPLGHGMLRLKNGNLGNKRKAHCFHISENHNGAFLLFERGQEKNSFSVCVSY